MRELEARAKQLRDAAGLTQVDDALAAFAVLSEAAASHRLQLAAARSAFSGLEVLRFSVSEAADHSC